MNGPGGGLPADLVTTSPHGPDVEPSIGQDEGGDAARGPGVDDANAVLVPIGEAGSTGGHELRHIADAASQPLEIMGCVLAHAATVRQTSRPSRTLTHPAAGVPAGTAMMARQRGPPRACREGHTGTMARTSAKRPSSQVIRTYAAADRAQAERSYLRERQQAATRGWVPHSRRWRSEGHEHVLTVVYESVDLADPFAEDEPVGRRTAEITSRSLEWTEEQARQREALAPGGGDARPALRRRAPAPDPHRLSGRAAGAHRGAPRAGCASTPTHIRRILMYEPRGHRDMYGAVLLPPDRDGRRRGRPVHAQRGLQHDVRPRHHRAHAGPHRGGPLPGGRRPVTGSAGRRRRAWSAATAEVSVGVGAGRWCARSASATCPPTSTPRTS